MVPWICQRLDVAQVCSKPHTACLPHQTGLNRFNFGKSVNFVQAFIISKFRSGEEGGHISLSQNEGKFYLHHD